MRLFCICFLCTYHAKRAIIFLISPVLLEIVFNFLFWNFTNLPLYHLSYIPVCFYSVMDTSTYRSVVSHILLAGGVCIEQQELHVRGCGTPTNPGFHNRFVTIVGRQPRRGRFSMGNDRHFLTNIASRFLFLQKWACDINWCFSSSDENCWFLNLSPQSVSIRP